MTLPPPEVCQLVHALQVVLGQADWKEDDRSRQLKVLAEHKLAWSDLPAILAAVNTSAPVQTPELLVQLSLTWADMPMVFAAINATAEKAPRKLVVFQRLIQLFGLFGRENRHEAATARKKLDAFLIENKLGWTYLTAILAASVPPASSAAPPSSPSEMPEVNVFDLVSRLLEMYVVITAAERTAIALYALFTHVVFKYFSIAPRLAVLSPTEVSGKTLLIKLLEQLVHRPYRSDNITAAAIFRQLYFGGEQTMLLDEGDNLGLFEDKTLRATLNSGYDYGGRVTRVIDGRPRAFRTFGPLVMAAIGRLPLPYLSRCVATIKMLRPTPDELRQVEKLDLHRPEVAAMFNASRWQIEKWAATCILPRDPPMPSELRLRNHDNWQSLIAVADSLGRGEVARAAAVELCGSRERDHIMVRILTDVRTIFERRKTDRILSALLVVDLIALDDFWLNWRGPKDDRPPRKLTQTGLAELLSPFDIKTRTVFPIPRLPDSRSGRGYHKAQFLDLWERYCPQTETPAQSAKIIALANVRSSTAGDTAGDTKSETDPAAEPDDVDSR